MSREPVLRSVVALRSHVPDDAFTADALGTLREGSGVVISDDGLVVTIGYLITEAEEVWLTTHDNRVVAAHPLAYDQVTGFGLVQAMGALDLPALEIGASEGAAVGDAVTFADGTGKAVTSAIVARQEFAGYWEYLIDDAIFIAPAHPSWGGGALIGADGKLIGVGSLRLQMSRNGSDPVDINMAVPTSLLTPILDDLRKAGQSGQPARPWLGVYSAESDGDVVVMSVQPGSPAASAGVKQGDVISDVRDTAVNGLADFYRHLWQSGPPGTQVPMRLIRNGRETWLRIKTADRNDFLKKPQLQ